VIVSLDLLLASYQTGQILFQMSDSAYVAAQVFINVYYDPTETVIWSSRTDERSEITFGMDRMGQIGDKVEIKGSTYVVDNIGIRPNSQGWHIQINVK